MTGDVAGPASAPLPGKGVDPSQSVVVTGAAGFIGSHVSEALLARGHRVLGIDNYDPFYDRARKDDNANAVRDAGGEVTEFDLTDADRLAGVLREARPSLVIHLAAKAGVRPSIADPVGYTRANLLATSAVMHASHAAGVERLVIASSSSVYGNNRKTPFAETDAVEHPISPYAATKRSCELLASTHHHLTSMPVAMLRFFTVYGPRQRPDLAISKFLSAVGAGRALTMFGDGSMSRDFTFIDDIVSGVLAAGDCIASHGYRIWNLGSDRPVRVDELVAAVGRTVGRDPIIEPAPVPPGDVERTWADLSRSRSEIGYAPSTTLDAGLGQQWVWMQERGL